MIPDLDIRGSGRAFFILHNGAAVAGPYSSHGNAISALGGVTRRLAPDTPRLRRCRACRHGFLSTGGTHCPRCKEGG